MEFIILKMGGGQGIFPEVGTRNTHGIPLVGIKVVGKEGWKGVQRWEGLSDHSRAPKQPCRHITPE